MKRRERAGNVVRAALREGKVQGMWHGVIGLRTNWTWTTCRTLNQNNRSRSIES